jgi:MarR family transcriptional regulator, lower aerobic nicotinate degradation pathway regulator
MREPRNPRTVEAPRRRAAFPTVMLGAVPIQRAPSALARRLQQICAAAMAQCLAEEDLTPLQYAAFPFLREEPGLDQVGLALRIGIDRTNVGLLIDHLEARGFVERRFDSNDRRVRRLHLTPRGLTFHDRVRPIAIQVQQQILACLTAAEKETLIALLVRVIQANEKLAHPGLSRRKRQTGSTAMK